MTTATSALGLLWPLQIEPGSLLLPALCLCALLPLLPRRWRPAFLELPASALGFVLAVMIALLCLCVVYGPTTRILVIAGPEPADATFDGHTVHLEPGGEILFQADGMLGGRLLGDVPFACVSATGRTVAKVLGPNLYVAECSGRETVGFMEVAYDLRRKLREDYVASGETRGDARFVSADIYDILVPLGSAPPVSPRVDRDDRQKLRVFRTFLTERSK